MSRGSIKQIFTIGHSTRSIDDFIALLKAHKIEMVVDVRTIPKSRHCPQFNQDALRKALKAAKVRYRHMKILGGFRHPLKNSINTGWVNASFRGFADYMQSENFEKGLEKLESIAKEKPTVIMCAEAVPWRCHRSLIADALVVRKWKVFHIQSKKNGKTSSTYFFFESQKHELML